MTNGVECPESSCLLSTHCVHQFASTSRARSGRKDLICRRIEIPTIDDLPFDLLHQNTIFVLQLLGTQAMVHTLQRARDLMREALRLIDEIDAAVHVGPHLDLALSRLEELLDESHHASLGHNRPADT